MKKPKIDIRPNALELFGIRKVNFLPLHFETTIIKCNKDTIASSRVEQNICDWIENNTAGRFYIDRVHDEITIGFEQPKEYSYFILAYK